MGSSVFDQVIGKETEEGNHETDFAESVFMRPAGKVGQAPMKSVGMNF